MSIYIPTNSARRFPFLHTLSIFFFSLKIFLTWSIFKVFIEFCNNIDSVFCFGFFGYKVCGILTLWPGIKPTLPTLGGEVSTTGLPGRSPPPSHYKHIHVKTMWNPKDEEEHLLITYHLPDPGIELFYTLFWWFLVCVNLTGLGGGQRAGKMFFLGLSVKVFLEWDEHFNWWIE